MDKKNRNITIGIICAIVCESLFGLSYTFTKSATKVANEYALLGWRFFIAFIIMSLLVVFKVIKVDLKGKSIKPLLLVSVFSPVLYFIGETIGISKTTASESGMLLGCIPVAALIASTIVLKRKPTVLQTIGILMTLIGVIVTIIAVGMKASLSVAGYLFLLLAIIGYAMYSVFVKKADKYSGVEITYMMLVMGCIVFVSIAIVDSLLNGSIKELITLPFSKTDFLIAVLYQSIACSIVAFFLSNTAISKLGVNKAASFIGLATVVSIISGVIFLEESINAFQIVGSAIIVTGVCVANTNSSL